MRKLYEIYTPFGSYYVIADSFKECGEKYNNRHREPYYWMQFLALWDDQTNTPIHYYMDPYTYYLHEDYEWQIVKNNRDAPCLEFRRSQDM